MKRWIAIWLLVSLAVVAAVTSDLARTEPPAKWREIKRGMTVAEMTALLGTPDASSVDSVIAWKRMGFLRNTALIVVLEGPPGAKKAGLAGISGTWITGNQFNISKP